MGRRLLVMNDSWYENMCEFKVKDSLLWHDTRYGPCCCGAWHENEDWLKKEKEIVRTKI